MSCGHVVVLGRLANTPTWVCESCGKTTDLIQPPFKDRLVKDLDIALQIDLQAKERGEAVSGALKDNIVCNLYSITTNQAAIINLFRGINRYVGNLRCRVSFLTIRLLSSATLRATARWS